MVQMSIKHPNGATRQATVSRDITALEGMIDYAIAEGAQMQLPLFVCMLRLARLALKEECEEGRDRVPERHY